MKKNLFLISSFTFLAACGNTASNELRNQDYAVSYKDSSQKASAECLLDYIVSEQLIQKKAQIIAKNDTVLVRLFGKPKGNWKKNEERKTAEFANKLLANDFSKICFQKKIVRLQIGQDFSKAENYLEATSDDSVGFRDYKPQ